MARNELFKVTGENLGASTGDLATFSTDDFTQIVVQLITSAASTVGLFLQVSPDGTTWFEEVVTTGSLTPANSGSVATATADVAFGRARFRWANATIGDLVTVRVLGRF